MNRVYFEGAHGYLHAVDAQTGTPLWNTTNINTAGYRPHNPAIADGIIYLVQSYHHGKDAHVVPALDATTGAELWSWDYGQGNIVSSPAVYDGVVYSIGCCLSTTGWDIVATDAKTGEVLGVTGPFSDSKSDLAIENGVLYIGSYGNEHRHRYYGTMYAINISSGKQIWEFPPLVYNETLHYTARQLNIGSIYTSPAVSNGVVYFGSEDGNLYAVG